MQNRQNQILRSTCMFSQWLVLFWTPYIIHVLRIKLFKKDFSYIICSLWGKFFPSTVLEINIFAGSK